MNNMLLLIGVIILLGTVVGKIFRKLNLPQVMGYMILGFFIGESFRGFLSGPVVDSFRPIISLALGIIGFMIGAELNLKRFKRYSRSIYTILFAEAFLTFFLVGGITFLITGKVYIGLMLGALSSATAPAATYGVLGEYKARGPVTMTALSIVALDDALALLIYGFASVFARSLIVHENPSILSTMAVPLIQIVSSVAIGAIAGFVLHKISKNARDKGRMLSYALGTIILVVGLSIYFKVDPILASMVLGVVASNLRASESREMFEVVKKFSSPIFILFFVLVGARLDARILAKGNVLILAIAYIASRSVGKVTGAYIGGKLSGAKATVTKYLGFCLFDQAGVAVGLAIATFHTFSFLGDEARAAGFLILSIITATTFLLQLIAPPMIKYGIKKADEINRDITEEDVVESHKVSDLMEKDFPAIKENFNLPKIISIMKETSANNFPVIKMNGDFMGVISLGEIRDAFNEEQMDQLILAGDIAREVKTFAYSEQELKEIMDTFKSKNIEYIPVLAKKSSRKLAGQLEYRKVTDYIAKEVLLRQQELEV